MIKRIVEISGFAKCSLRRNQLVVDKDGEETKTVPLEDLGIMIFDGNTANISTALIAACAEENITILFTDTKHLPVSVLQPLAGNSLHTKVLESQVNAGKTVKKRIWTEIVRNKIINQAQVVEHIGENPGQLLMAAQNLRSGDPENHEGYASRIYFPLVFGEDFRRNREEEGINSCLNYGYAIIRATIARAIVGTGLHPSIGVFHHNQYDSLCLADDTMEPFRPMVDLEVKNLVNKNSEIKEITREIKQTLLSLLVSDCLVDGRKLPFFTASHYYAASIRKNIEGDETKVQIPTLILK